MFVDLFLKKNLFWLKKKCFMNNIHHNDFTYGDVEYFLFLISLLNLFWLYNYI